MREIKFRAWDEDRKEMQTSPKWVEFKINTDGILAAKNVNFNKVYVPLEIMQYTGLTDKNGVDIYEGDIVESISELIRMFDGNKKTGKMSRTVKSIEYRDAAGSFCFCGSSITGISQSLCSKYYTVIGNIYESPELMEK